MMPHPERSSEPALGGTDGMKIFHSMVGAMAVPSTLYPVPSNPVSGFLPVLGTSDSKHG